MLEVKVRNRESTQADAEMLMNALAAMQDKNTTLEKNLSAETRVKLDLFSALGAAKRQLEISDSMSHRFEEFVIGKPFKLTFFYLQVIVAARRMRSLISRLR